MMATQPKQAAPRPGGLVPAYELRVARWHRGDSSYEIWQVPATATPHLHQARRVAGLAGRNLALVEHRIIRRLTALGINTSGMKPGERRVASLPELDALRLGLLWRLLAPMRSLPYIRSCAEGIEAMGKEEAAYWLGMAMHRRYPRRVLMALRVLLVDPRRRG